MFLELDLRESSPHLGAGPLALSTGPSAADRLVSLLGIVTDAVAKLRTTSAGAWEVNISHLSGRTLGLEILRAPLTPRA